MNVTMNLINSDKGLKENYFFYLDFYFFEYVVLIFIPKGQKTLVFMATRPKKHNILGVFKPKTLEKIR